MFLFEPREKGLAENQDQRRGRVIPGRLKPPNSQLSQQVNPTGLTEAGILLAWEEWTCRRAPTYKAKTTRKFKSTFTHDTFLSLSATTVSAIKVFIIKYPVHQGVQLTKAFVLGVTDSESLVAFTSVTSHCVYTAAVLADPRFGLTFILICIFEVI